jgi:lactate 2-monooxygenase
MLGGQEGVEQVLKHTNADLDVTLGLSGWQSLEDLHLKGDKALRKMDW